MSAESILIQYLFYGGVFIVGLIILFFMKRSSKKPFSQTALAKTEALLKRTDKLSAECGQKYNVYAFMAKSLRLSNDIGDLVVLAENEVVQKRNIAYDGVLSAYQAAAKLAGDIDITYNAQQVIAALGGIKTFLSQAESLITRMNDGKK